MNEIDQKLYQDQLYGAKVLSPLAVAIIDTPEFQRLSGLRQLGFADVVYRSARHSRFEHSVGTFFLSRTIMRRIVQNHERLGLEHPGTFVSPSFRLVPTNSGVSPTATSAQSRWRGLAEVVSAAALLHDLGHVPFGHTLEDEFAGLYNRHDRLAGPRLYQLLFNEFSGLAKVFSSSTPEWLKRISNEALGRLIYIILNWKESVHESVGFRILLEQALRNTNDKSAQERLTNLLSWYDEFAKENLFHPFMSDIIGNTICADLLDYLPRDRLNLGMESLQHTRLQRYFTIRPGTLYPNEGLRLSIMVTRKGRGGQRKDVATAVLAIMRERYEMAERVFYHHKKAAASAMLAKLIELAGERKPRDDENIYPAPWQRQAANTSDVPHTTHLSDAGLIEYVGNLHHQAENDELRQLRKDLNEGLRFNRKGIYRTLLVVDTDLPLFSSHALDYIIKDLRGTKEEPKIEGRNELEKQLANAAGVTDGRVIVYCPSDDMQSKEVDARLEIKEDRVLPLRLQSEFAYRADVDVLTKYYTDLWRAYIFVSPEVFQDAVKCKAIVDAFCQRYGISEAFAYRKVRTHNFTIATGVTVKAAFLHVQGFVDSWAVADIPRAVMPALLAEAAGDPEFLTIVQSGADSRERLTILFEVSTLKSVLADPKNIRQLSKKDRANIQTYCTDLLAGSKSVRMAALGQGGSQTIGFDTYVRELLISVTETSESKTNKDDKIEP